MKKGIVLAVALVAAAVVAGWSLSYAEEPKGGAAAGGHAKEEQAALAAADAWLKLVDSGDYAKSWEEAAAFFKGAVTKDQWQQSLAGVRKPLGKTIARTAAKKEYTTSAPGAPDGQYVAIQYDASFENKKQAVETVTPMLDKDGKWRVSGYFIR